MNIRYLWLLVILFLTFLIFPGVVSASTLSISPGNASINLGSTRSFQVRLNTQGEAVNAVSAVISYPQDLVTVTSINASSTFSIQAEQTFGGGTIKISRGNLTPVNGTVTIATFTVRGVGAGSTSAYFTNGSAAPRASDSTDSLKLSESVGTVITVGTISQLPQAGSFDQTQIILIGGGLLTLFGLIGTIIRV